MNNTTKKDDSKEKFIKIRGFPSWRNPLSKIAI